MGDFNGENYKDTFISELVTFVAGDRFQSMFESFFIEHALQFSPAEEHELKYYEIYQQFHELFEGQLESFCSRSNVTQSEFMVQCRAAREKDAKAKHYIDILLSSVEYETFVKLMKIMRPVAESRLNSKADPKKVKDAEASLSSAKSQVQAKSPSSKEGEEEDPFAAEKGSPRSQADGKRTGDEEGEFSADSKNDRYNSSGDKESSGSK